MRRAAIACVVLSACVGCSTTTTRELWKTRLEYYVPQVEKYASAAPAGAETSSAEIHRDAQYSIAVVQVPAGKEVAAHSHASSEEAVLVVRGVAMVVVRDRMSSVGAGESFVVPAGQTHNYKNAGTSLLLLEVGSEPPADPQDVLGAHLIGK